MKHLTFPIAILFLVSFSIKSIGQATPQQMVAKMGRGINLGNVLSAPYEGNWAPAVEESYFEDVVAEGFTTVRIPIRFDKHTTALTDVTYTDGSNNYIGSANDYTVDQNYLDRVEQVVDWALSKGLVAIIDVHGDKWFWESYDTTSAEYKTGNDLLAAEDRFRAIWSAIANRFQTKSENLLFEIMNEPYFSMSASEVDAVNTNILGIIRQANPTRNVIITGGEANSWQAPLQISNSLIASDTHLIATFHYYVPFKFTSSSKQQYSDYDWGTDTDKANVDSHFDTVLNWSQTNNIPVLLGEFGADNSCGYDYVNNVCGPYGGPDNLSRVLYHDYIAEAALSRGFSFTAWDAGEKSNKTIYKVSDRSWVEDVKNALLGKGTLSLAQVKSKNDFQLFPNPSTGVVKIQSNKTISNIHLYTSLGQFYPKENSELIDVSDLKSGIYLVKVIFENGETNCKKLLIN
ncbi:cellulase family glycosylhydrolase [Gaetbulibacter sp. M240]|uniref:cellulase family glycosylhydrolase n=1 Tax=Gaetbulibacter sp. M240 TaxID=3126511 RepID=UPI00374EA383